eukprot:4432868-Prymnesium_polylepis.1
MFNFALRLMYHVARLANEHGAVTCTLLGMFFLVRGEPPSHPQPDETPDETDPDTPPPDTGISGAEITPHTANAALYTLYHEQLPTPCCPALFSPP